MVPAEDGGLRDVWLIVHILLVLAGYAALFFTALSAVAYLVQEKRLKSKQGSALLERLPPLATLDTMLSKSLGLSFAFLTLGLVFGVMWAFIYLNTSWIGNPSVTISIFTWVFLLIMMFLRSSAGWRGRNRSRRGFPVARTGTGLRTATMRPSSCPLRFRVSDSRTSRPCSRTCKQLDGERPLRGGAVNRVRP